jgi:hypothetical protein
LPPSPRAKSRWPLGIFLGLLFVVVVNVLFIYIAVSGADRVAPSYAAEPR